MWRLGRSGASLLRRTRLLQRAYGVGTNNNDAVMNRRPMSPPPRRSLLKGASRELAFTTGMWGGIFGGGSYALSGGMSYLGLLPPTTSLAVTSALWGLTVGAARGLMNAGRHVIVESGALSSSIHQANVILHGQAQRRVGEEDWVDIAQTVAHIYESLPWVPRREGPLRTAGLWITYQVLPHVEYVVIEVERELAKQRLHAAGAQQMQSVVVGTCHGLVVSATERVKDLVLLCGVGAYLLVGGILVAVLWTKQRSRAAAAALAESAKEAYSTAKAKATSTSETAKEKALAGGQMAASVLASTTDAVNEKIASAKEGMKDSVVAEKVALASDTVRESAKAGGKLATAFISSTREAVSRRMGSSQQEAHDSIPQATASEGEDTEDPTGDFGESVEENATEDSLPHVKSRHAADAHYKQGTLDASSADVDCDDDQ